MTRRALMRARRSPADSLKGGWYDAGAVLNAPAVPFSIDAAWFHKGRISSRMRGRRTCQGGKISAVARLYRQTRSYFLRKVSRAALADLELAVSWL